MNVLHRQTNQGRQTRFHLLSHIQPDEELTRNELAQRAGLTYEQVRRQTKNLVIEGWLDSYMEAGQRRYRLCKNFKLDP